MMEKQKLNNLTDRDPTTSEADVPAKSQWGRQLEFVLACVSFNVGLGNILRFPYLCMRNGGGAFLIPYFLSLLFCGIPLFFLEICLGQFSSLSPLQIWAICPLFKGIGIATIIFTSIIANYYNMYPAWVLYYLFKSLTSSLPWSDCDNTWNTPNCYVESGHINGTFGSTQNETIVEHEYPNLNGSSHDDLRSSSEEFWKYSVLRISSGVSEFGDMRWELFGCLALAWFGIAACLCKGIKSLGKVVYVTALLPYLILLIFLVRGLTLPGSLQGLRFYIIPDWKHLKNVRVWSEACMQIFYSLGPGWGGIIAMAQYNKFRNNCLRDAIVLSVICCGTSFLAGFVIFSVLGFMSHTTGMRIEDMASGPGLAFIAYPEAILKMPISPLWSVLFFLMLLAVGLGSQFSTVEVAVSSLIYAFPKMFKKHRIVAIIGVCSIHLPIGLIYCTQAGMYYFQIVDWYVALFTVTTVTILECFIVMWIYGHDKFSEDVRLMLGYRPSLVWKLCWGLVSPLILLLAQMYTFFSLSAPSYGDYTYPPGAVALGWVIAFSSALPIPAMMIYQLCQQKGSLINRFRRAATAGREWTEARKRAEIKSLEKDGNGEEKGLQETPSV